MSTVVPRTKGEELASRVASVCFAVREMYYIYWLVWSISVLSINFAMY